MASHGIQVSCRIRDVASSADVGAAARSCISVSDDTQSVVVHPSCDSTTHAPSENNSNVSASSLSSSYSCFDCIFSGKATQEVVFERIGKPFVDDVLAGYNCTVLAYGHTGSGKTFTTIGNGDGDTRGLIPRAMERIFQKIEQDYQSNDASQWDVQLTASFIEVYQENLRDLLLPHNSRNLRIREDRENGLYVEGASEILISSVASGMAVLARGNTQRATGATLMNADSSRSHCVFALTFTKKHTVTREKVRGKLLLVAGRLRDGEEDSNERQALGRSQAHQSPLGNVINALTDGKSKYIPYRDSKLTRLLQSSLGGNAKTHLLLTCSASEFYVHETLSTLRFGARAKRVLNIPHVNNEKSTNASEYKELLSTLKAKIESLCSYIQRLESSRCANCCLEQKSSAAERGLPRKDGSRSSRDSVKEAAKCCSSSSEKSKTCEDPLHCDNPACTTTSSSSSSTPDEPFVSQNDPADLVTIDADSSRSTSRPSSSTSEAAESHRHHFLLDELMQEELNSLRRAVVEMQCDRHEVERARRLASAMLDVSHVEGQALNRTQAEKIHQQEAELTDAHVKIGFLEHRLALLQSENSQVGFTCEQLRLEAKQLKQQQIQWGEAQNAEAEILRRRLTALEKQAKKTQVDLLASQKLQEELRVKLLVKEQELRQLDEESASLRFQLASSALQSTPNLSTHSPSNTPLKQIMPRSFTAMGELGSLDTSAGGGMGNIQSWWAGSPDRIQTHSSEAEMKEQQLSASSSWRSGTGRQQSERRRANSTKLVLGGGAGAVTTGAGSTGLDSPMLIPPPESLLNRGEERRCRSQGAQSRPFRARLVGLLNSLEEETSSLKELISESQRDTSSQMRPAAARAGAGAGKQRYHLPCLETQQPG